MFLEDPEELSFRPQGEVKKQVLDVLMPAISEHLQFGKHSSGIVFIKGERRKLNIPSRWHILQNVELQHIIDNERGFVLSVDLRLPMESKQGCPDNIYRDSLTIEVPYPVFEKATVVNGNIWAIKRGICVSLATAILLLIFTESGRDIVCKMAERTEQGIKNIIGFED